MGSGFDRGQWAQALASKGEAAQSPGPVDLRGGQGLGLPGGWGASWFPRVLWRAWAVLLGFPAAGTQHCVCKQCPCWVSPTFTGCICTRICTLRACLSAGAQAYRPPPSQSCPCGCPGLCCGGHVPIPGHSTLEFRPLPACSLLANYKLSDLYSLTSTRQRQA